MTTLQERLMVAQLHLTQWYPRRYDKQASEEIARAHGASSADEAGRYNKILVSLQSIAPLQSAFKALRGRHYDLTAPWTDRGSRILPVELYFPYIEMLGDFGGRIEKLADRFAFEEYAGQREEAKLRLGTLFSAADYPTEDEVRAKFTITYRLDPLPDASLLSRFNLPDDVADDLAQSAEDRQREAITAAHTHVIDTLLTRANEFVEKVRNYDSGEVRVLYAAALENLRDVAQLVSDGLNVEGDPRLTKVAGDLCQALDGLLVDHLRTSVTTRRAKAAEVARIVELFGHAFEGWEQ